MIDLKLAQKQPEIIERALKLRHSPLRIEEFLALDAKRKNILANVEQMKARRNKASGQVAVMKRNGEDASELISELSVLSDQIQKLDQELSLVKEQEENWLMSVPNIPDATVPEGLDETGNVEIGSWGERRIFDFPPREHGEYGVKLNGLDFERAAKLAGSRFVVEKGWLARLDRALINFFLDWHVKAGYLEISPPLLVNALTMTGTGQLPKFEEDLFRIKDWNYYLIPTAEVPLTNLHAQEVLDEKDLPLGYCAATPCFRSEAGSAGRDTRGLIRMHQFNKVEMVRFSHPDDSFNQLEGMTRNAASLLEALNLPYRIVALCTGDLGFGASKTYDIEVWLPAQKTYREISSCSNCTDFQARRANIRFKPKGGKSQYVHTLNGSGLPTGRTIAAILENYQQKDGSLLIPEILRPYMRGLEQIEPQ